MVAVGLFAVVMLLASGAYLIVIGLNRQAQATATGINNVSFALETMTRNIRTGSKYSCSISPGITDCTYSNGGSSSFYFVNAQGKPFCYALSNNSIIEPIGGPDGGGDCTSSTVPLTDSTVVINTLRFYLIGSANNDRIQPQVVIVVSGTVDAHGKTQAFNVETSATMRGTDLPSP
jgi:hypothetical protein